MLCHEGCCRKLPQDCRPVAEVGNQMMHLWKPAGCVLYEGEVEALSSYRPCRYYP